MSDSVCPVCGKPTSNDMQVCQNCGAALGESSAKPLQPAAPPASEKPGSTSTMDFLAGLSQLGDDEEDIPAWLKNLQNSLPVPAHEEPAPTPESEPETGLRSGTVEPQDQPVLPAKDPGFAGEPAEFLFDESPEPGPQSADASPDWLNELKANDDAGKPASPEAAGSQPGSMELPDWLAALTGSAGEQAPAKPEPGLPEQQPSPEDGTPEWISSLGGEFIASEPSETVEPAAPGNAEMPDWLARMSPEEPVSTEPTPAEKAPTTEQPSWLADLQSSIAAPAEQPDNPEGPEPLEASADLPAGELPSWLADLQKPALAPAELPSGIPDWMIEALNAKTNDQSFSAPEPVGTGSLDAGSGLPALIAGLGEALPPGNEPGGKTTGISSGLEMPGHAEADSVPASDGGSHLLSSFIPGEKAVEPEMQTRAEPDAEPIVQAEVEPTQSQQSDDESLIPASTGEQNVDSILSMDAPDWLSGISPAEAQKSAEQTEENSAVDDLPAAELPSWVQAMRPMESVIVGTGDSGDEQDLELQGPLAGLSSVLPTQTGLAAIHKPNAYSVKLLTSESQQAQAALLESLLNSENNPQTISKQPETIVNRVLRWIIAAVLFASILISATMGSGIFPAPVVSVESSPVGMFRKVVTELPDGALVLVVMDYQPGFAGEMEAAAGPVMEQLMSKNSRLAFVSTTPMGDLMASRLMQKYAGTYPYTEGDQYVTLGYLPGGAGSIKAFADQPRATLGQDSLLGNLWDMPVLADVTVDSKTTLSNFAAVIVATDNPDTGRLWIEQAEPMLGSKPMLMVVSAQAEPMISPYLRSNQLKGLVTGLEGGLLYESGQGKSGQARAYWDAFGAGLLAAVLLILSGGVWSLVSGLRARRTAAEQDEA